MPPRKRGERRSTAGKNKARSGKRKKEATAARKRAVKSESKFDRAQKLIEKALQSGDCGQEIRLALEALELWRDCAEAYLILAQHQIRAIDALPFFEAARDAGARNLGSSFFKKERGRFWETPWPQPFLKGSGGFAECLWAVGRREEAFEVWRELLDLDRQDHLGVRHVLQVTLLECQRTDEAIEVLERYPEESAWWHFNKLLASYQQSGDTEANRKLLKQVRKLNRHIIRYLLKDRLPKEQLENEPTPGSAEEATVYVTSAAAAWWQTPGAISWLRRATSRQAPITPVPGNGPTEASKKRLQELRQQYGLVFQAAVHQFPNWTSHGDQQVRPWVIVMVNCDSRLIVTQEITMQRPTTVAVWDRIVQGLCEPFAGKPQRPSEIQVYEHPVWEELRPHFQEVGIDVIYRKPVDEIDYILSKLQPMFAGELPESNLLSAQGMTAQLAGDFYGAAAEFYRQAPWQYCSEERPLEIQFPDEPDRIYYAVVTGQGGDSYGFTLHESLDAVFDQWDDFIDESSESAALSVHFGEQTELTAIDVDAIERNHWPIATPEAYPTILRTDAEQTYALPSAKDLQRVETCLRLIPKFARRHHREKEASETFSVESKIGPSTKLRKKSGKATSKAKAPKVRIAWSNDVSLFDHDHDHDHDGCEDLSCSHHDHDH